MVRVRVALGGGSVMHGFKGKLYAASRRALRQRASNMARIQPIYDLNKNKVPWPVR
jgi:hypothetical protein